MLDIILDTVIDALKILPFLFLAYLLMEYIEHKTTKKSQEAIKKAEREIEGKGKVLVRKSGTEPKIQVWVWSDVVSLAEKINAETVSVLEKSAGFETKKTV